MELIDAEYVEYIYKVNRLRLNLAKLITYQDSLKYHIAKSLSVEYMLKIGALEYELVQIQNNIEKNKKIIKLAKDKNISFDKINAIINKEFLEEDCKIALMGEAVDRAIKDSYKKILSEEEIIELNSYYMPLVRDLDPVINLNISDEEILLFETIKEKYISGDIEEMEKYKRFQKNELYFDELEVYKKEEKRLLNLIKRVNKENLDIKDTYPYTERKELLDENLLRRRKDSINKEISKQHDILKSLEKEINELKK